MLLVLKWQNIPMVRSVNCEAIASLEPRTNSLSRKSRGPSVWQLGRDFPNLIRA